MAGAVAADADGGADGEGMPAAASAGRISPPIWSNGEVKKQHLRKELSRVIREFEAIASIWFALSRRSAWASFRLRGWTWRIDSDGDLCGFWEGHLFCFRFLGDSREVLLDRCLHEEPCPD